MRAIANIELDEKSGPGLTVQQRFDAVLNRFRQFFPRSIAEVQQSSYKDPSGSQVDEATAVIVFEYAAGKDGIVAILHKISGDFNQDCIAVQFCDGTGRLAGPRADIWGPFKPEYFKAPTFFDMKKAA